MQLCSDNMPNFLCDELHLLQLSGMFCDVVIEVDDEKDYLSAHSNVLAACSPFISSHMLQSGPLLHFPRVKASTWRHILDFMYTGKVDVPKCSIEELFTAALELRVQSLVKLLEPECNNARINKCSLEAETNHNKNSNNEKATCPQCNMAVLKINLGSHQSYFCPSRQEMPPSYDCTLCMEEFLEVDQLVQHVLDYHQRKNGDKEEKQNDMTTSLSDKEKQYNQPDELGQDKHLKCHSVQSDKKGLSDELDCFVVQSNKDMNYDLSNSHESLQCMKYHSLTTDTTQVEGILKAVERNKINKMAVNASNQAFERAFDSSQSEAVLEISNEQNALCDDQGCSIVSFSTRNETVKVNISEAVVNNSNDFEDETSADKVESGKKKLISKKQDRMFSCDRCGKVFTLKRTLTRHISAVHKKDSSYKCDECGQTFPYSQSLQRHKDSKHSEMHIGGRSPCNVCGVSISGSLAGHMWIKHGRDISNGKRKLLQCNVCGQRANSLINLRSHMNVHTGTRCFQCSLCNASFKQASCLRKHVALHDGQKSFSCSFCGRSFARKTYLQQHERLHTGEKPYKCHVCHKAFPQKTSLNIHLQNQHNVLVPKGNGPSSLKRVKVVSKVPEKEMAAAHILCNLDNDEVSF